MAAGIDFIADTSAIIGLLRRDGMVEEKVREKEFAITFVTLAELSLGVLKAARAEAAWRRIQDVLGNRQMFPCLDVNSGSLRPESILISSDAGQ